MDEHEGKSEKNSDDVRSAAHQYVVRARYDGREIVTISAGDVVRELSMQYRVPTVCSALTSKKFLKENGLALEKQEGPPSGVGTTSKYTYRILQDTKSAAGRTSSLMALRGAGKEMYKSLGGGEAHLKKERTEFDRP